MKKYVLLITVTTAILLSACGGPAPVSTQAPAQTPASTQAPAQPMSTVSVPATGTEVDIKLADNTIESSLTTFQVGVPYTFVIKNQGNHAHNLNVSTPVSVAGSLDAALSSALLVVSKDQLQPGSTATVQYTFPDSAAGAQLEFSCLIKRHYQDNMKLAITVTK